MVTPQEVLLLCEQLLGLPWDFTSLQRWIYPCSPRFDHLKMVEVLTLGTCCFNEDRDLNHRNLGMFQQDSTTKWQFPPPDGCWLGSHYVTQSHTANFLGGFIGSMPNSHGRWVLLAHVAFHEIPTNLVWSLLTSPFSISEITCFVDELPTFIFEILYNSRWWHHFSLFLPTISFFLYVCCLTSLLGVQFHFWLANNINVGFWLVQGPPLN